MRKKTILLKNDTSQLNSFEELMEAELKHDLNELMLCHDALVKQYDSETLHELRVTLRRLLTFLRFFKHEVPRQEWSYVCNVVKYLIKPTSKVRDFDVFTANLILPACRKNENNSEYTYLRKLSDRKSSELSNNLMIIMQSKQYQKYLDILQKWIVEKKWISIKKGDLSLDVKIYDLIERRLNKKFTKIGNYRKDILDNNQKELHKMRMNVKELRYDINTFKDYLKNIKPIITYLKKLQDLLGAINDSYVAEKFINQFRKDNQLSYSIDYIQCQLQCDRNNCFAQLAVIFDSKL